MKGWTLLVYASASMMTSLAGASFLPPLIPRDAPLCLANTTETPCFDGIRFCCPATTSCLFSTSNNDSVLCCPNGQDCSSIRTISCDIQQQNAATNPLSAVQTVNLDDKLETCGTGCCPRGFTCKGGQLCSLDTSKTIVGTSQAPTQSSPTSSTTAAVVIPTSTSPPPQITILANPRSNPLPAPAVILGLFLGLLFGIALIVVALWLIRRRRKSRPGLKRQPSSPSFMGRTPRDMAHETIRPSYIADTPAPPRPLQLGSAVHSRSASNVSEPMWSENLLQAPPHRTDFLLRRGSCETGYEATNKPTWSSAKDTTQKSTPAKQDTSALGRGRSRKILDVSRNDTSNDSGSTPQMATKPTRQPLFAKPLKLDGKAVRPEPRRPPRSDENVPQILHVGGSHMRDDSQSRTLVAHDSLADSHQPRAAELHGRSKGRSGSTSSEDEDDSPMTRHASGETINVMLTPEPAAAADLRRETTFSDIMRKAGWKKGIDGRF